ncbi:MAG: hypothetical protein M1818_004093 [Claussenomyces sp. TS43310]|nr:MAG: hypothetical protein M1818_004093 [Claussenomyces sp. TS43310]
MSRRLKRGCLESIRSPEYLSGVANRFSTFAGQVSPSDEGLGDGVAIHFANCNPSSPIWRDLKGGGIKTVLMMKSVIAEMSKTHAEMLVQKDRFATGGTAMLDKGALITVVVTVSELMSVAVMTPRNSAEGCDDRAAAVSSSTKSSRLIEVPETADNESVLLVVTAIALESST